MTRVQFPKEDTSLVYIVRGSGGQGACIAVQSVLQEHGLCGHTQWQSIEWRFECHTDLGIPTVKTLLGDLITRFKVSVEPASPASEPTQQDVRRANVPHVRLRNATLRFVALCGVNLAGADLRRADLEGTDLRGASLAEANLSHANLANTDLSDANLCGADLRSANLARARLCRADLSRAVLTDSDLDLADLTGAIVTVAQVESAQSHKNAILPLTIQNRIHD